VPESGSATEPGVEKPAPGWDLEPIGNRPGQDCVRREMEIQAEV